MSSHRVDSLHMLPIELVYRILDYLDGFNLIFSARNVCTRLNEIVDTYHPYQVDIVLISSIGRIRIPPLRSSVYGASGTENSSFFLCLCPSCQRVGYLSYRNGIFVRGESSVHILRRKVTHRSCDLAVVCSLWWNPRRPNRFLRRFLFLFFSSSYPG